MWNTLTGGRIRKQPSISGSFRSAIDVAEAVLGTAVVPR